MIVRMVGASWTWWWLRAIVGHRIPSEIPWKTFKAKSLTPGTERGLQVFCGVAVVHRWPQSRQHESLNLSWKKSEEQWFYHQLSYQHQAPVLTAVLTVLYGCCSLFQHLRSPRSLREKLLGLLVQQHQGGSLAQLSPGGSWWLLSMTNKNRGWQPTTYNNLIPIKHQRLFW